jgi:hypothetical protein
VLSAHFDCIELAHRITVVTYPTMHRAKTRRPTGLKPKTSTVLLGVSAKSGSSSFSPVHCGTRDNSDSIS